MGGEAEPGLRAVRYGEWGPRTAGPPAGPSPSRRAGHSPLRRACPPAALGRRRRPPSPSWTLAHAHPPQARRYVCGCGPDPGASTAHAPFARPSRKQAPACAGPAPSAETPPHQSRPFRRKSPPTRRPRYRPHDIGPASHALGAARLWEGECLPADGRGGGAGRCLCRGGGAPAAVLLLLRRDVL